MTIKVVPTKGVCYLPSGDVVKGETTIKASKEVRRAIVFGDLMIIDDEAADEDLSSVVEPTADEDRSDVEYSNGFEAVV